MQNVVDQSLPGIPSIKKNKPPKIMGKILNNRSMNQNIFNLFVQKKFKQCQQLINRCQSDQFKIYINSLLKREQFKIQKSLGLLNQCQSMNKHNFNYLKTIAKNFYLLGKYKSSLEAAKDAIKLNSNQYQIYYILGKISLALNDPQGAVGHFKYSIDRQLNQESFIQIAKIQIKKKQYIEATKTLKQAKKVSSQNPQLYQMLGCLYIQMGSTDQGLQFFKLAIQKDHYLYNSLIALASIHQDKCDLESAMQNYKKAYKLSPNSPVLWNNLGLYMYQKKKMIAAYSCFKRSLFFDPFRWDVHSNIALLLMNNKKYIAAHIHLRSAIQLNKDSLLFNWLGICLSQLNDHSNAAKAFQQSIELSNNPQVTYNCIVCLIKAEKRNEAQILYKKLCSNTEIEEINGYIQKLKNQF